MVLIKQFKINVDSIPIVSDVEIKISRQSKELIIEKLLEAHLLASANVKSGNITGRGFATNICTVDNEWFLGTNFNNTRNDISSICGERAAILNAYNQTLIKYSKNMDKEKEFSFKIKYLCMATNIDLNEQQKSIAPCEDCLSWLNTNRYFDNDTLIFSFEKDDDEVLKLYVTNLSKILPFKQNLTSVEYKDNKPIKYTHLANDAVALNKINKITLNKLIQEAYKKYSSNNYTKISNQNIAASILINDEIISSSKIDWTRRWFVEPLELSLSKAIEKYGNNVFIKAIAYFGDEVSKTNGGVFNDGVVSIKSLGRIRQKYASNSTVLILNLKDEILITTLGEYLPKKFIQGYKIH